MKKSTSMLSAAASVFAISVALAPQIASAQDGTDDSGEVSSAEPEEENVITVTGFRSSLAESLNDKRSATSAIDVIQAEDIGKFPDSNLAESMQRISGVALSREDGAEGKNITVRGLSAEFTRVRINGMEGTSQTGASDIYGNGNQGRSFDFNVFPTELFSSLAVRKTPSADIEEGSLGATVDLQAPHPLDQPGEFVFTATARGVYNDVAQEIDPRVSMLMSQKFNDGTMGLLGSFAYSRRHTREVGYSATRNLPAWVNGGFCSPIGVTPQNPSNNASQGTTDTHCATGVPRTGSVEAYEAIQSRLGPLGQPGGGAFFPRIPRYVNIEQEGERIGGTLSFQWEPSDRTLITIDGLYSRYDVERADDYISLLSFARSASAHGQPMTSVLDIEFDENGTVIYGLYDGVDIRSEGRLDFYTSEFKQVNIAIDHELSDVLSISAYAGQSKSSFDRPRRSAVSVDSVNRNGVSVDFRGGLTIPIIDFGFDVSDASEFGYEPRRADRQQIGTVTDGQQYSYTLNTTLELEGSWELNDNINIRAGGQYRESDYNFYELGPDPRANGADNLLLPPGVTVADFPRQIEGFGELLGGGVPSGWAAGDQGPFRDAVEYSRVGFCGVECGNDESRVIEKVSGGYLMAEFDFPQLSWPIRGNVGVRYVHTDQQSTGHIPVTAPAGSYYSNVGELVESARSYEDWLPSANLVIEPNPDLLLRFSAAKVLSRAQLAALIPNSGVSAIQRTGTVSNPNLDPIRATTYDAAVEWYFARNSLLSVAYFRKDIDTYIQSITQLIPFNELGLPLSLLNNSGTSPDELFVITRATNTPGGTLEGVEVSAQVQFDFLPGFLANTGAIASYTHVSSQIEYILESANGVPVTTTTDDLIGLSPDGFSGTLYYEDDVFSIRSTASYRAGYIRAIPSGSNDSDVLGNHATWYVDASASFNLSDSLKLLLEVQNITKERNQLYVDSVRQDPLYETEAGRTYTLGITYRY